MLKFILLYMGSIKEHDYLKICAELASVLTISIAAAKKKIDVQAAKKGTRDISSLKDIAETLLAEAREKSLSEDNTMTSKLDTLLEALAQEENFMVED